MTAAHIFDRTPEAMRPDAKTPTEMREAIFRYAHTNAIARHCMGAADHAGMSGEDRYVLLAYHALRAHEEAMAHLLRIVNTLPTTQILSVEVPQ